MRISDHYEKRSILYGSIEAIASRSYVCGYCSCKVSANMGYALSASFGYRDTRGIGALCICPECSMPTLYLDGYGYTPQSLFGKSVLHLPSDVNSLNEEARSCYSQGNYSACAMVSRKILMHVAVEKEAEENKSFRYYVTYLYEKHIIPINANKWVDEIRSAGNEANHDIKLTTQVQAERLLYFTQALLQMVYELPGQLALSEESSVEEK